MAQKKLPKILTAGENPCTLSLPLVNVTGEVLLNANGRSQFVSLTKRFQPAEDQVALPPLSSGRNGLAFTFVTTPFRSSIKTRNIDLFSSH